MQKLKTPLMLNGIYLILLGLATLSPSIARSVFGYEVKDPGVLLVLSGAFLGYGVVVWVMSSNVEKYGGLATAQFVSLVIAIVFLLWGWFVGKNYTARNALVPLVINVILAVWIWTARPKS